MNAFFVTGTDTEIGKTTVTAGLTWLGARSGLRSVAVKPVAAGQELLNGIWVNSDVQQLLAATNLAVTEAQVGPIQFRQACAPHIAAQLEGRAIHGVALLDAVRRTLAQSDVGFVEGVGGFRVPLSSGWDTADMARELRLPVLLVVGMRLGCLNHALLTVEAIRARGLELAGWVANTVDPAMPYLQENLDALSLGLQSPCWGLVPRLHAPIPRAVAAHLQLEALRTAMLENFV
jgi:dethiobiotin synthetase